MELAGIPIDSRGFPTDVGRNHCDEIGTLNAVGVSCAELCQFLLVLGIVQLFKTASKNSPVTSDSSNRPLASSSSSEFASVSWSKDGSWWHFLEPSIPAPLCVATVPAPLCVAMSIAILPFVGTATAPELLSTVPLSR